MSTPALHRAVWNAFLKYRWMGYSSELSGNLTARDLGLRSAKSGWTPPQIEALLFLRDMYAKGRWVG